MKVIIPPEANQDFFHQLLFLAGPIAGAPNWQELVIQKLKQFENTGDSFRGFSKELAIANPRKEYPKGEFVFERQVDWESFHLKKASTILFWLPKEETHIPDRAYAQTSRFELAEWLTKKKYYEKYKDKQIIVGIEDGFPGKDYIMRRLQTEFQIPVYHDLDSCLWAFRSKL